MSDLCLYCKRRMRGDLIGWRPVSISGRVAGWECPRCQRSHTPSDSPEGAQS